MSAVYKECRTCRKNPCPSSCFVFFVSGFGTFAILKVASGDEKKSDDSDKVLSEEEEQPTSPDDPSSACPFGEPGTDYLSSTKNVRKINKYLRSVGRVGIFDAAKPDANAVLGFGVFKPLHVDMPPEKFDSYESMGAHTLVHCRRDEKDIQAFVRVGGIESGQPVRVIFTSRDMHFFDYETGKALPISA